MTRPDPIPALVEQALNCMTFVSATTGMRQEMKHHCQKLAEAVATAVRLDWDEEHPQCETCHGTGRTDNHVTGEVECSTCEGAGYICARAEQAEQQRAGLRKEIEGVFEVLEMPISDTAQSGMIAARLRAVLHLLEPKKANEIR